MSKVSVEINSEINEIFSKSTINQKFSNQLDFAIELEIHIFKIKNVIFSSFNAKIGDSKIVKSKVIKKEKAEEKYIDSISSGNAAIFVKEESDEYIISLGNIPSKEKVIFISEFIQFTENVKSFQFELSRNLPIFRSREFIYQNVDLTGKLEIQAKGKIINIKKEILLENLKIVEEKYKNEEKNNYLILYQIETLPIYSHYNKEYIPCSKIFFNIERDKPAIYLQKSPFDKNKQYYVLQYINKISESLYLNPALIIFLVDQSGSMGGNPIKIASKAIELFLHSLPANSYYQIIGFGSFFIKYEEIPKEYTEENIKKSLEKVKKIKADLGGTNIYKPLREIFNDYKNIYGSINLPKNIILLTDGEVDNKNKTLKLIEANSMKFSIYSIGIGKYFDEDLVKNAGILGKGNYNFCKDIENLNSIMGQQFKEIFTSFNSDLSIKSSIDTNNIIKNNNLVYDVVKDNEIINIYYITDKKEDKINLDINFKDNNKNCELKYEIIPEEIKEGEELSKLIINNYLLNNSELDNEEKIKLALKYQLLTKDTSLFAEIELNEKVKGEMKSEIIQVGKEATFLNEKKEKFQLKHEIEKMELEKIKNIECEGQIKMKLCDEMKKMELIHEKNMARINNEHDLEIKKLKLEKELHKALKEEECRRNEKLVLLESEMKKINNDHELKMKELEIMKKEPEEICLDRQKDGRKMPLEEIKPELFNLLVNPNQMLNPPYPINLQIPQQPIYPYMTNCTPNYYNPVIPNYQPQYFIPNQQPQIPYNNQFYQKNNDLNPNINKQNIPIYPQSNELGQKNEIINNSEIKSFDLELEKLNKEDIMKIIYSQDLINGYWEENEMTNLIKKKYIKEYNLLKGLENIKINIRIAITIIIIYFIYKDHSELFT